MKKYTPELIHYFVSSVFDDCCRMYGVNAPIGEKTRSDVSAKRLCAFFCYHVGITTKKELANFLSINHNSVLHYFKTFYLIDFKYIYELIDIYREQLNITNDDIDRLKEPFNL